MTLLIGVILASLAVYSWKIFGYLVPERFLSHVRIKNIASLLTIALLAALVGVQGFTAESQITFDARVPALVLAAVMLKLKAPFIFTVAAAAGLAAALRFLFQI
ncbi:MAG: hypothetical protein RL174_305 [Actinomycetota bacterium]